MRFLLVDPPFQRFIGFYRFYFPLGLTYLAAVLRQAGHEVLIYDSEHDPNCRSPAMKEAAASHHLYLEALENDSHPVWQEYQAKLAEFKPDIVGLSVLTVKHAAAVKLSKLTKEFDHGIITVAGGEHVTVRPQDALVAGIDYVVNGEGEQGILHLAHALGAGESVPRVISCPLIQELDSIPMPAIDAIPDFSTYRPVDLGLMMTARGCPFGCSFCGLFTIWGRQVRYHSTDRVIREIRERKEKYSTTYFSFRNGTFTLNRRRVVEICRRFLDERLAIEWECLTRVDALDAELLTLMKEAGCRTVRIGIESGSSEILRYMGKGVTLDQVRQSAKLLNDSGIFWSAYFMIGVPAETEESLQTTAQLIREIDPPFVTMARFTPLPGTCMYQEVVQGGLLDEADTDWTWAANQSLDRSFVTGMEASRFLALADEMAEMVKQHNERHAQERADARLKT